MSDVGVETDIFYPVSIVVVLLSSQVLSEQSSLNLLREVKYESEEKVSVSLQSSPAHEAELASLVVLPVTTSPHLTLDLTLQSRPWLF